MAKIIARKTHTSGVPLGGIGSGSVTSIIGKFTTRPGGLSAATTERWMTERGVPERSLSGFV